jgi:hypothetical protein
MERRTFLTTVGAGALAGVGGAGGAAANEDNQEENPTPADGSEAYVPKVNEIRSPLAGVPTVVAAGAGAGRGTEGAETAGDVIRVELAAAADIDLGTTTAYLEPSFGSAVRIGLQREATDAYDSEETAAGRSRIWNEAEGESEAVDVVEFRVPSLDSSDAFTPDLYDLVVEWDGGPTGGEDRQPRAVSVRRSVPEELDVAVIADPQIGDPRGLRSGFQQAQGQGSPDPFVQRTRRVTGDRPDERWAATRRAIAEVNALDPDIVLVAGDLCLGQDAPGKFYAEYEDAWAVMNHVRAPTFMTCGNHDGYVQSGTDGKALYRDTFGPPSYSVEIGDAAQVVAVDTYDWSYLDRLGAGVAVSTYGGQVRNPQLGWLREELARVAATDRSILAVGHHNPSWIPDKRNDAYAETDGRPLFEQVARGSRIAKSGQLWTGENAFALRRLFDGAGVDAFFCGHSHQDRVARSMADRETSSPALVTDGDDPRITNVTPRPDADGDGDPDGYGNGDNADIVAALGDRYVRHSYGPDPDRVEGYPAPTGDTTVTDPVSKLRDLEAGTLYVNVASTMSSTAEYWGWRQFSYPTDTTGLDPLAFQYDMTDAFLRERAVNPDAWAPEQDAVGLFSTPSYLLDVVRAGSANSPDGRRITITNEQTEPRSGALRVSTTADDPAVDGGEVLWRRDAGNRTDLKIAFDVAAPEDEPGETVLTISGDRAGPGQGRGGNGGGGGGSGGNGNGGGGDGGNANEGSQSGRDNDGGLHWPLS